MASLSSDKSGELTEEEKLARSMSKIRIRKSSKQFNVDLNGIVNVGQAVEQAKRDKSFVSHEKRNSAPSSILGKAYSKAFLANYPDKESAVSKVYKKTILANYPVPDDSATVPSLSFSDGGSESS